MSSSLLPFLAITAINQRNIINQQRMQISSLQSKSRRNSYSSSSYRSTPKLPQKMSAILDKADERSKGVSYFDLLVIRTIHSDEKAQNVITKLNEKYNAINAANATKVQSEILSNANLSQQLYNKSQALLENIKGMGFDVSYPGRTYYYSSTSEDIKIAFPSSSEKTGYTFKTMTPPDKFNGIKLSSEMFKNGKDPFNENLKNYIAEHPTLDNDLKEAEKEVANLSKNKLALLFSKKKREALKSAENKRSNLASQSQVKSHIQENADFYNKLSSEQKSTLVEFLSTMDGIKVKAAEAEKFVGAKRLIEKNASMACPTANIRAYHSAVVKEAIEGLTTSEKATLTKFENKAVKKLISLSDEQAVEILKNSPTTESSFEIDGNRIDTSILFEISNNCHEKIEALNPTKTDEKTATKANESSLGDNGGPSR